MKTGSSIRGRRLKYLFLVSFFPPHYLGGSEVGTLSLAQSIVDWGCEVHVVTRSHMGRPSHERTRGVYIHRVRYYATSYYLGAFFEVLRLMPDVIEGITIFPNGFLATVFGRLIRRFSVVSPGGPDIYEEPAWFRKAIVGPVLKHCGLVVAKTRHMKKQAQVLTRDQANIVVIPNGVDISAFKLDRHACRYNLNIPESQVVILFVGRLVKIKGIEHLLNAMPKVLGERNARLLLVGEDLGESRRLSELAHRLRIHNNVTFVGRVDPAKVPGYMLASDILVMPSLSEGFPLVILQAMAAGLPIVASNVTGIPEILRDGENGYLVRPGDSEDISDKILLLVRSPETRRSMQATNIKTAETYSWEKVAATLLTTVLSRAALTVTRSDTRKTFAGTTVRPELTC